VSSERNEAHNEHLNCKLSRQGTAKGPPRDRQGTAKEIDRDSDRATNEAAPLAAQIPAELAALEKIWPKLPEHIRAAIMALAGTVKP
jgi:hypothetical protein